MWNRTKYHKQIYLDVLLVNVLVPLAWPLCASQQHPDFWHVLHLFEALMGALNQHFILLLKRIRLPGYIYLLLANRGYSHQKQSLSWLQLPSFLVYRLYKRATKPINLVYRFDGNCNQGIHWLDRVQIIVIICRFVSVGVSAVAYWEDSRELPWFIVNRVS